MSNAFRIRYPKGGLNESAKTLRSLSEGQTGEYNDYLERLVKLIPAEAIGIYLTIKNLMPAPDICKDFPWLPIAGLIPLLIVRTLGSKVSLATGGVSIEWPMVAISTISYIIWIYAVGDCIYWAIPTGKEYIVGITVILWTFLVPYIYKQS